MQPLRTIQNGLTRIQWIEPGLILVLLVVFAPIFFTHIYYKDNNDFVLHTLWARQMVDEPSQVPGYITAHSGWQFLVIATHTLTQRSWKASAFVVTLALAVLTGWIIYRILRRETRRQSIPDLWAAGLALALVLVAPVSLLEPLDGMYYLGYLGINTYHNPTILALKPFAVMQFFYAIKVFTGKTVALWREIAGVFIISILAAFIKPNFTICLLPAMGILALVHFGTKKNVDWKLLIFGFGIPSAGLVLWQMLTSFASGQEGGVIFFPFGLMNAYSSYLAPKFLLSILFPVLVTALNFKTAIKDIKMVLAWGSFFFGAFFTYFLAENGGRFLHGNFAWSGEISMFILFAASTLFLVENGVVSPAQKQARPALVRSILWTAWGLHAVFGLLYYAVCLFTNSYQ